MNCLNKEPRAGGEGPSAEEAGVGAPADQDMEAADDAPAAAAPRRQLHLDQELFLADPAIDSSASLEVGPSPIPSTSSCWRPLRQLGFFSMLNFQTYLLCMRHTFTKARLCFGRRTSAAGHAHGVRSC